MIHQKIKALFTSSIGHICSDISSYSIHPHTDFQRLAANEFTDCGKVKRIVLPAGIVSVDKKAFSGIDTRGRTIFLDASLSRKEVKWLQKKLQKA